MELLNWPDWARDSPGALGCKRRVNLRGQSQWNLLSGFNDLEREPIDLVDAICMYEFHMSFVLGNPNSDSAWILRREPGKGKCSISEIGLTVRLWQKSYEILSFWSEIAMIIKKQLPHFARGRKVRLKRRSSIRYSGSKGVGRSACIWHSVTRAGQHSSNAPKHCPD